MLEEKLITMLLEKELKITTVESCTGGLIASKLVNVSGASQVFEQGYVTYSESAKEKMVGVNPDTIEEFGVVSVEVASEMAMGGCVTSGADIAVSVTGIAGPGGGTAEKPVGLCCIGCCYKGDITVEKHIFSGNRQEVREKAAEAAIELAIRVLY